MMTDRERIACGAFHPDAGMQQRCEALAIANTPTGAVGGCGRAGIWTMMFRCTECCRWFHRECAMRHFAAHGDTSPITLERLAQALCDSSSHLNLMPHADQRPCAYHLNRARDTLVALVSLKLKARP